MSWEHQQRSGTGHARLQSDKSFWCLSSKKLRRMHASTPAPQCDTAGGSTQERFAIKQELVEDAALQRSLASLSETCDDPKPNFAPAVIDIVSDADSEDELPLSSFASTA